MALDRRSFVALASSGVGALALAALVRSMPVCLARGAGPPGPTPLNLVRDASGIWGVVPAAESQARLARSAGGPRGIGVVSPGAARLLRGPEMTAGVEILP